MLDSPSGAATWEWHLATGEVRYSAAFASLLGTSPDAVQGSRAWWLSRVATDDRARMEKEVARALRDGPDHWKLEYRLRRADGSRVAVLDHGFVVRFEGKPLRALGIVEAVRAGEPEPEEPSLRERAEERERAFRSFAEFIPQLAWSAHPSGWIDFYNQRWYDYTGTTFEQVEGWGWVTAHDPLDLPRVLRIWRNAFATGQPWEDEFRLRRGRDGMLRWHLSRAMPVRDAQGRIVRWFGTSTDVHDQKLALEDYSRLLASEQRARREAEAASRAKDEFLAVVSHELRSPLNAMLGWTQLLRTGSLSEEKRNAALEKIESSAQLQAKLVEDLLDISRIITGKLKIEMKPVEIGSAVLAAVEALRPTAQEKGITLAAMDGSAGALVHGDAGRVQQIVANLLTNALKFTPAGRRVEVAVGFSGDDVEIEVRDEGEGFAPDFLPRLFERFSQADSSSTRKHGGLGLGLSIVRELVDLHGGEVTASSPGEGGGATFTVRLPIATDAGVADAPAAASAEYPGTAISLSGVKVLAVDDERGARELVAETMLSCGATVTLASSVHEALRAFKLDVPDVVVSDIGMPERDGYSLIKLIRSLPDRSAARTPIVALTAYASLQDRERALRAGFDRYLPKPVDPARLSRLIAELLRASLVDCEPPT